MGNRRKLTEVEEFYVEHNPENLTIEEMAIKMGCNKNILIGMLDIKNTNKPIVPETKSTAVVLPTKYKESVFTSTMGRRSVGGRKGLAVMTPAASEIADEARKNKPKGKYHSAIHHPRGEDYDG